jgi:hypothetical protein
MRKPCFLLLLLLLAIPSWATDRYVAKTGNDTTGDGSPGNPWATIGKADSLAQPGWTIHVAAGLYAGAISTSASGTPGNPITFVSDTKWGAHVTITTGNYTWTAGGNWVNIQDFQCDGGPVGLICFNVTGSNVRMLGNRIHDIPGQATCTNGQAGIDFSNYAATGNEANGNFMYNIGTVPTACAHALYIATSGAKIYNNVIGNVRPDCIQLEHGTGTVDIIDNTCFNMLANGANSTHGVLVGCTGSPCSGSGGVDNVRVYNNIIRNSPDYGIRELGTTGLHNSYIDNSMYQNGTDFSLQNGNTDTGSVSGDPMFVNYQGDGSGDYHLTALSPCIDKGISAGAPSTDFDGVSRPQGTSYDIGAYEFVSGRPAPPPGLTATVH